MSFSIKVVLAFLFLLTISLIHAQGQNSNNETTSNLSALHRGKSGIYVRLSRQARKKSNVLDLIRTHPLVDAVVLSVPWREVEPKKEVYSFDSLLNEVNQWGKAGKGVVINVFLYGQSIDNPPTPPWIYEQPGVRAISFRGGHRVERREFQVPAVWDEGFAEKYLEPMIKAFAKTFDGNPHVWYIMAGFGHLGNMNAEPSKRGGKAFIEAGFTPARWENYCRHMMTLYRKNFTKTPLVFKAAGILIKDPKRDNYRSEAAKLHVEFAKEGASIIRFGLGEDRNVMTQIYSEMTRVIPDARRGITRIGLGDDMPLWAPESGRREGPTRGHDEQFLRKSLDYAFGNTDGIPEIPTTILFSQDPEILASNPRSKNYSPEVADILKKARERLKKNDLAIFGISSNTPQYKSSSHGAP